jgi:hypothetical protein
MGQQWHSRGGVRGLMGSGFWLVSRAAAPARLRLASLAPRGKRRVGDRGEGISCEDGGAGGHVHVVHCRIGRHLAPSLACFGLLDLPWPRCRWMPRELELPSASMSV